MIRKPFALALSVMAAAGLASLAQAQPQMHQFIQADNDANHAAAPVVSDCGNTCDCCEEKPFGLLLGFRPWFSWANTNDVVGTSVFEYRDNYSTVYEFNIDGNYKRLIARVDIGVGNVDDGSWSTGTPPVGLDVTGDDLFYITADFGYRLFQRGTLTGDCARGCALDALAGYQYWRETYETGGLGAFSNEYSWSTVRLGGRGIMVRDRLTLQARLMFSPYTDFDSATSGAFTYTLQSEGGWGVFSDISASYRVWRNVSAELGYQAFYLDSASGAINNAPGFDGVEMVRHGLLVGLNVRF